MSGYRTLHRENTNQQHHHSPSPTNDEDKEEKADTTATIPIWHTLFSPCAQSRPPHHKTNHSLPPPPLRFVTASADGYIRAYEIMEKEIGSNNSSTALDASALKLELTNILCGANQSPPPSSPSVRARMMDIGYSKVDIVRNYVGQDTSSGDEVIVALRLDGLVRLWVRPQCPPYKEEDVDNLIQHSCVEFKVEDCTGTTIAIRPPSHSSSSNKKNNNLTLAMPNMNGSISFYDCGIPIYNPHSNQKKDPEKVDYEEPKLINSIGSGGAIITSVVYHPTQVDTIAVGRKNGVIDVYYSSTDNNGGASYKRLHHFTNHYKPIRALSFSSSSSGATSAKRKNNDDDGALLITASDDGNVFLYDIYSRSSTAASSSLMVASIPNAHTSWILSSYSIPATCKFVTAGADGKIKVWDISMINAGAVHTFDGGTGGGDGKKHMVWGISVSYDGRRMVSCDDGGMIQIYSCEE